MPTSKESTTLVTQNEDEKELLLFSLDPKVQRFIQMYMTGQYTILKLAELLKVHPNTIHNWMRKEEVKNALQQAQGEVHVQVSSQLKSLTLKAVNKLNSLVDSPIDAVALQAVKDVLDRGGHKTKQEIKVDKTVTTVEQKLAELIDATIIDADYEEVGEE